MEDKYIEALYEESRNAIPSWQGYHYQGQVAVLYLLKYILDVFNERPSDINKVFMKIEWLEDFIIFEKEDKGDTIKQVYQVKKTMDKKNYEDVIQNFIWEFKIASKNIFFKAIYNAVTEDKFKKIDCTSFNQVYNDFIENKIIHQIYTLIEKKSDLNYWKENLKLTNKYSELKNIRGYIRNYIGDTEITEEVCEDIGHTLLKELLSRLKSVDGDYDKFNKSCSFENVKIETIDSEIIGAIDELVSKKYIKKSDILSSEQIKDYLYIMVYTKLMNLKSKKVDGDKFIIDYKMIETAFCNDEVINTLWKKEVYAKREDMVNFIKAYICDEECTEKSNCDKCVFSEFKELNIINLLDNCNLDLPVFTAENAKSSIQNKLADAKSEFLINAIWETKNNALCDLERNVINIHQNDSDVNISQVTSGTGITKKSTRAKILDNIWDHLNIYKDYEQIVTKEYEDTIHYQDIRMIKDYEKIIKEKEVNKNYPTFMELPSIKFIPINKLEEK